jgi:hypothetical protein
MKIFECEFCGKQFPRLYFLTRHYERKYKCYTKNEVFVLTEEECLNKTLNEPILVKKINDNLHDETSDEMSDNMNHFGTQNEIQNEPNDKMNHFGTQNEIQNEPIDKMNHFGTKNEIQNEPILNEPILNEPILNEPKNNEPKNNEPNNNEPKNNEPKNNEPILNEPILNEPKNNEPKNNEPKLNKKIQENENEPFLKIPNLQKVTFEETCDFNKPVIKFKKEDAIKLVKFNPSPNFKDTDNRKTKMRNYANKKNKTSKNYSHHIQIRDNNRIKYNLLQEQKEAKRIADIDAKYDEMMRQDALEEEQERLKKEQLKKERSSMKQIKQNEPRRPRLSRRSYDNFLM